MANGNPSIPVPDRRRLTPGYLIAIELNGEYAQGVPARLWLIASDDVKRRRTDIPRFHITSNRAAATRYVNLAEAHCAARDVSRCIINVDVERL
jgi:hypothetical protein